MPAVPPRGGTGAVKRHKYGAVRTQVGDIWFDSKREAERYMQLTWLQKAGEISGLELQPEFELGVGEARVGIYRADFQYWDLRTGELVIEDVKGVRTPLYKWKKKHCELQYGITIREV